MARENRRLLLSLAHPDDETFGFGGTIARYSQEGADVHLVCATNGDVGTISEEYMEGFSSVADRRMSELMCAAEVLGVTVHTLDYRDSGMAGTPDNQHPQALARQDVEEVAGRVARVIRQVRPQVVITFDPDGGYFHPDHIAIQRATVRAFEVAGDESRFPEQLEAGLRPYRPQKLYYSTSNLKLMRLMVRLAPLFGVNPARMGRNKDMDARAIAEREVGPVHAVIKTGRYRRVMQRAWECHASQQFTGGGAVRWAMLRMLRGDDLYTRIVPPVRGRLRERDLFEGVELDGVV